MKKVLIVAAHPDDEVLGCGGTVARLVLEGYEAYTLILGEGITSRDDVRSRKKRDAEINKLQFDARNANEVLGVQDVFFREFPDNRFDTVALLDIVKAVEKVKNNLKPSIIFTHYGRDLNVDHQVVYRAVITATRPLPAETTREIYSFEVLSSTEQNYPLSFSPDVFFDISNTMDTKLKSLGCYKSEIRDFPHPRSPEGVKLNARAWGMRVGISYAEPFKTVRVLK